MRRKPQLGHLFGGFPPNIFRAHGTPFRPGRRVRERSRGVSLGKSRWPEGGGHGLLGDRGEGTSPGQVPRRHIPVAIPRSTEAEVGPEDLGLGGAGGVEGGAGVAVQEHVIPSPPPTSPSSC